MIFKHRRLLTLSLFTVLCVLIAQAMPAYALSLLLPISTVFALLLLGLSPKRRRLLDVSLALFLLSLALLSSLVAAKEQEAFSSLAGEGETSVTIEQIVRVSDDETEALGRLNGKGVRGRIRIVADGTYAAGDLLVGYATLTPTESGSYSHALGIYATVRFDACRRVGEAVGLRITLGRWRTAIVNRIQDALPGEDGALLCALLLGVREGVSDTFSRDMSRIGTIHMLSLSGMHFVILSAALIALLERTRLPKPLRTGVLCAFSLFFMVFTGLSSSVMRACFMFVFSVVPSLLREERDSLSSLACAVAVICLLEPYAVRDIALWLSAMSSLGILLFFDRLRRRERPQGSLRRLLSCVLFSFSVTLCATVATLPLTLVLFGTLPLLSPVANLLLAPLMQIALYLAVVIAVVGGVPFFVWISQFICKLIFTITEFLAGLKGTVLPVSEGAIPVVLTVFFVLLLSYYVFCPRRRFRGSVPISLLLVTALSVGGIAVCDRVRAEHELTVRMLCVTSGDALLFSCSDESLFVPVTSAYVTAGEETLFSTVGAELDGVLLPFYGNGSLSYLEAVLSDCRVFRLYLPVPQTGAERELYAKILALAAQNGIPTTAYGADVTVRVGDATLSRFSVAPSPSGSQLFFEAEYLGTRLQYYSGGRLDFASLTELCEADVLIFGGFGGTPPVRYFRAAFVPTDTEIHAASPATYPFVETDGIAFRTSTSFTLRKKQSSP